MTKTTPLYDLHRKAQAKMVEFAGWDMPLHYGSQIEEHQQVREHVGVFDVSHMGILDLHGVQAQAYLHYLLANNVDRLVPAQALYSCMLNEQGGVIDDLLVYKITDDFFRMVVNAGTREKDLVWMQQHLTAFEATLQERSDLAMLAIQGPEAQEKLLALLPNEDAVALQTLQHFHLLYLPGDIMITRTGYTGEDGYEVFLPAQNAPLFWQRLLAAGIKPCGLGARDTLRLEAGLNLYGADMDDTVTPLASNLAWTVAFEPKARDFIGRRALEQQLQSGVEWRLVGLVLEGPGILRHHQKVIVEGIGVGEVTSGGYSPTLAKSIALARVPEATGTHCLVEIRDKQVRARVIKPPFIRHGKQTF